MYDRPAGAMAFPGRQGPIVEPAYGCNVATDAFCRSAFLVMHTQDARAKRTARLRPRRWCTKLSPVNGVAS